MKSSVSPLHSFRLRTQSKGLYLFSFNFILFFCSVFAQACGDRHKTLTYIREMMKTIPKEDEGSKVDILIDGLHRALEKKRRDVVKLLIKENTLSRENKEKLYQCLVKEDPKIACDCLGDCITYDEKDKKMTFDFKYLGDSPYDNLNLILRSDCSDLLVHPLVKCLVNLMWKTGARQSYLFYLIIVVVYLVFLTSFAMIIPNPQLDICSGYHNDTNETSTLSCGLSNSRQRFLISAQVITIGLSSLFLLSYMMALIMSYRFTCIHLIKNYKSFPWHWWIKRFLWIQLKSLIRRETFIFVFSVCSILFMAVSPNDCFCPHRRQWQLGTVAVFLSWISFIVYISDLPSIGFNLKILWTIIYRFLTVALLAVLLLLAFGFAFYMVFYEPKLSDTPFETPFITFVTMISFAISSPDFSIFRLANDETNNDKIPFPLLSYSIWIIFGVVMSVLFLNFLTGLAVDDVGRLKKQVDVERMKLTIRLVLQLGKRSFLYDLWHTCKLWRHKDDVFKDYIEDPCDSIYVEVFAYWLADDIKDIIKEAKERIKKKSLNKYNGDDDDE